MAKKLFQFKTLEDCPDGVMKLTKEGQKQWLEIANALLKAGDGKEYACERAWTSIKESWSQNDEGEWMMKQPPLIQEIAMPYSLEDPTHSIEGVEVFEAGIWNGDKYTEKDLDEMVKNFGVVDAPLKIGHDPKQKIAGQPAVGWIQKIYRKGKKLYADITGIPKTVYELVKKGAYKKRSAEILYNFQDGAGKVFNNVFGGLALLGGELPALNKLEDVVALYGMDDTKTTVKVAIFEERSAEVESVEVKAEDIVKVEEVEVKDIPADATVVDEVVVKENEDKAEPEVVEKEKEDVADDKEVVEPTSTENTAEEKDEPPVEGNVGDGKTAEAEVKLNEIKVKLEALEAENTKLKAEKEVSDKAKEVESIKAFINSIEKKVAPASTKLIYEVLVSANDVEKKEFELEKGKKEAHTERSLIMKAFASLPDMAILNDFAQATNLKEGDEKFEALIKKFQSEGASYKDAYLKACKEHPELVKPAIEIRASE
ncbi:MAG: hypothetical protein WC208_15285 [Gallionella sp.]|jgi:hypothetical protein